VYLFADPVIRFIDEFFRGDDIRGFLFGLSTSQIISILLFAFATVFTIIDLKKRKEKEQVKA
jgi:phosphatidylglycerol:prolipoprotein diacylglycerol transferase